MPNAFRLLTHQLTPRVLLALSVWGGLWSGAWAQKAPAGQWLIVAGGWNEEQFTERRRPTQAELLAAAPNHPVYVQWMYGWAMLTPAAYEALNIKQESDLPGGGKSWAMQDAMYLEGDRRLAAHGEKPLERMPPLNTALRVGVRIGAGTDAHRVADYNPFIALRWMLDGKSASGRVLRANHEIPTRLQALQMYTSGSAWLAKEDHLRGTLEVGKWADLAVLTQDYFKVPLAEMADIESVLTLVGGRVVHQAPGR